MQMNSVHVQVLWERSSRFLGIDEIERLLMKALQLEIEDDHEGAMAVLDTALHGTPKEVIR